VNLALEDELVVRKPVGPPPMVLRMAAILAVPLLLYALVATGQKALDNYHLNQQADALRGEVRALRDENIQLQQAILQARTDASIEAIAREQLGLVKPGDHAVVLVHPSPSSAPEAAPPPPSPPPPLPPWRQWWDYFFG
jgi:cell division protein DivIC